MEDSWGSSFPSFPLQQQEKRSAHGGGGQRLSPGVSEVSQIYTASLPGPVLFLGGFQGY